jgi:hypothetical protein
MLLRVHARFVEWVKKEKASFTIGYGKPKKEA